MTASLCCPELIRNATPGGPDASSSLPNQAGNTAKYSHHSLPASQGHVQDSFWAPRHLTKSYLSGAAPGQPVWGLLFTIRNRTQRQKKMTLSFRPAHDNCMKLRIQLFQKFVFKPLHLPQSEPKIGTEIANAKMTRVEGQVENHPSGLREGLVKYKYTQGFLIPGSQRFPNPSGPFLRTCGEVEKSPKAKKETFHHLL